MFLDYFYGYYSYVIFMLPALIISMLAQTHVKSTFHRYSRIKTIRGFTGADAAHKVLEYNEVQGIHVQAIRGTLTDNFNPRSKVISLSSGVYYNESISSVAVAAHEAGHAVQYFYGYMPIHVRSLIYPVTQITSSLSFPLIVLGLVFNFASLVNLGIICFSFAVLFSVLTLPIEFNASNRAIRTLEATNILSDSEMKGAKKVLKAAAMTYLASTFTALWSLLRIMLMANVRRN